MKSCLFLIFVFTNYFCLGQNSQGQQLAQNCYELSISSYGDCMFGFSQQNQERPPTTAKVVKKNEKIIVYGTFGRGIKYIDKEFRIDAGSMTVTRSLKEVEGIVATSNNYGPSQRGQLRAMIAEGLVFAEVKYKLSECE